MSRARDVASKNLAVDTTPELQGDLTMGSNSIADGVLGVKNTGAQSELRLYCEVGNAHYVSLKAPAHSAFSGNHSITMPPNTGTAGQFLSTDGAGVTSWAEAGGGGNQVELTASGTLASGDPVVLNANGTVSAVTGTQGGAAGLTTYTTDNVGINSGVFHAGQNAVVIAYSSNTQSGAGYVVAGTVNASTNVITFGTPVQFESDNVENLDICYDSGSQLIHIAFTETNNGYPNIRAYSLSGTTLTAATSATAVNGTNSAAHIRITYDAYYDQLVVGFRDISSSNYARAKAFNYNAGTYTTGGIITMQSSLSYSNQQAYDPVNYKHVHVCAGNNGWPHAYTLTVSGTGASPTLSTSPATQMFGNAVSYFGLEYYPATQHMVFVYQLNSNSTGYVSIGIYNSNLGRWDSWTSTNSAYIISQGGGFSGQMSNSSNTRYGYDEDNQELMITFAGGSVDSLVTAVKVTAIGAITTRGPQQFDTFANYYHGSVYDTSQNVTVATFHDQGNGNKGSTAIVRFDSTNLTASNFIGFSAGAVTDGNTATVQTTGNVADNVQVPLAFLYQSSFSLSAQSITTPEEIRFKPDGTKFYILGGDNDIVYQYAMSTAWDISTASYENKNVSVQTQEATPQGLSLNADGTSIYVCGQSKSVYQYDLSSAYDVSTASYANKSFSFATQMPSSTPWGIDFNTDGTSMFAVGSGGSLFQYTLSTGFDVSTASYANKTFATGLANPSALNFTSNGTTLYVYNYGDGIYTFTLSTPFDLATISNANINYDTTAQGSQGYSVAVKPDGTRLYVTEKGNLSAYQYSLTTDLVIGSDYFVRIDGTLNTTADANFNVPAGKALSATKLLIA